jgi:hypothetical protein
MRLLRVGAANEAEARLYAQVSSAESIVSVATQQCMFRVMSLSAGVTLVYCTALTRRAVHLMSDS